MVVHDAQHRSQSDKYQRPAHLERLCYKNVTGPLGDHIVETCCAAELLSGSDRLWKIQNC